MSPRLLVILAELALAAVVTGWGFTTAVRPALWDRRPVRWWVGWTGEPVGRWEGLGVALAGVGMALSGAAAALATPTPAMPLPVRVVQLSGLAALVLAGVLLAVVHPAGVADPDAAPSALVADAVRGDATGPGVPAGLLVEAAPTRVGEVTEVPV